MLQFFPGASIPPAKLNIVEFVHNPRTVRPDRWGKMSETTNIHQPDCSGVGKCPNWTSPKYWGYNFQQIFEGDVQNPPKGTFTNPCFMPFLTNELQELFHPTAHLKPPQSTPPGCRRDPADHWARTPGHKLKSTQGKQWKILHWSSKKCGQLQGNLGKIWRKWGLTRLTLDFS